MSSTAAALSRRITDTPELGRDRRRYVIASGVGLWGAQIAVVAVPLTAVTSLSAGAQGTAMLAATAAAPFVVLGLPVGAWVDRIRRRPVMITADVVRAIGLATVPVGDWFGVLTFAHLWMVVLLNGVATVFFDLGTQSHIKDLAPAGQLIKTNGHLATLTQTALICAPPLAGWAAGMLSPSLVLALTSLGYTGSALWLSRLRTPEPTRAADPARGPLLADIAEGVRFVRRQPVLLAVLGAGCFVNFGIASFTAVLPALALNDLGWTESDLGLYLGAGGAGGLLGAMTANWVGNAIGAGRAVLVIGLIIAPLAVVLPLTGVVVPAYVSATAWAVITYKIGFDAVLMMSFRQAVTPAHLLGRVNGTMRVFFTAAVALGAASAAALAGLLDARGATVLSAVALGLVWVPIALSPLPRMSTLDVAQ